MKIPQIKIVNCETGEEIIREANAEELNEIKEIQLAAKERIKEQEAKAAARQALLDKLGITEDEAKLLLGGN